MDNNNSQQQQEPRRSFGLFKFGTKITSAHLEPTVAHQQQQQQQQNSTNNNNQTSAGSPINFGSMEAIQSLVRTANSDFGYQSRQQNNINNNNNNQQHQQQRNLLSFSRPVNTANLLPPQQYQFQPQNNNYSNNGDNTDNAPAKTSKYSATPPSRLNMQYSNQSASSNNNNSTSFASLINQNQLVQNQQRQLQQQQLQRQQQQQQQHNNNNHTNENNTTNSKNNVVYEMYTSDETVNRKTWQLIFKEAIAAVADQDRPPYDEVTELRLKMKRELEALASNIQSRKRTALLRKRSLADYERALQDLGDDDGAKKALELWRVLDETSATVNSNLQNIRDRFEKEHKETMMDDDDDDGVDDDCDNPGSNPNGKGKKKDKSASNPEGEAGDDFDEDSIAFDQLNSPSLLQKRLKHRRQLQQALYETQQELVMAASRGELTVEEAMMILKQCGEFKGKLMPFQEESLAFFLNLNSRGAAGLNADEMGLGKSCQSISILVATRHLKRLEIVAKLKKEERENYKAIKHTKFVKNFNFSTLEQLFEKADAMIPPALFIIPLSTSSSWAQEFQTFAPSLRVGNYGNVESSQRADLVADFFNRPKGKNTATVGRGKKKSAPKRRKRRDDTSSEEEDDDDSDSDDNSSEEDSDEEDDETSSEDDESDDCDDDSSDDRRKKKRMNAARIRKAAAMKKQKQQQQQQQQQQQKKNGKNILSESTTTVTSSSSTAQKYNFDVLLLPHHFFSQSGRQLYVQYFSKLTSVHWFYMIIDEAHRIKNDNAALTIALQQFHDVEHRLVLTGTPLQNSLDELWTLLSFLLPEVFSKNQFASLFKATADLHAIPNLSQATINKKNTGVGSGNNNNNNHKSGRGRKSSLQQKPILSEAEQQQAQALAEERQFLLCRKIHDVLLPLMIRREKRDVIQELPKLREWYVVCPNAALQKYESQLFLTKNAESKSLREKRKKWARKGILANNDFTALAEDADGVNDEDNNDVVRGGDGEEVDDEHSSLNNFCERRLALHPFMLRVPHDVKRSLCDEQVQVNLFKGSGKFIILDLFLKFVYEYNQKVLEKQRRQNNTSNVDGEDDDDDDQTDKDAFHHQHKILIFSQFASLLEMVETHVGWCRNWPYLKLDGSTGDRPQLLQEFKTNENQFIFLLTKGAGGVGLNLQAADTVILLDIDYNPTIDQQSLSRAYRVGQRNEVLVLKLISDFAAEKRVMEMASRKQDLENKIVHAGKFDIKAGDEERDKILREMVNTKDSGSSKNKNDGEDDEGEEDGEREREREGDDEEIESENQEDGALGVINAANKAYQVSRIKIGHGSTTASKINSSTTSTAATPNFDLSSKLSLFPKSSTNSKQQECEKIRSVLKKEILRFFPRTKFERNFLKNLIENNDDENTEDFLGEAVEAFYYDQQQNNIIGASTSKLSADGTAPSLMNSLLSSSKPPSNIPTSILLAAGAKWKSGTLDLTAESAKKDKEEILAPRQGKVAAEKAFEERRRMIEEGLIDSDDDGFY